MKKSIKLLILTITFIIISFINKNIVYGAIAIKDTEAALTGYTISEFYDMAKDMNGNTGSLAGTTVDVHMANNKEWATVSYFSNSSYGTAGVGKNTGTSHYSTNGNITGVMDWGKTYTFTAGIIESYASQTLTTAGGSSIINDAGTDKVDKFKASQEGSDYTIAKTGWYSPSINYASSNKNYPYSLREGLFRFLWRSRQLQLLQHPTCEWCGGFGCHI